jgi:hypothetical protein
VPPSAAREHVPCESPSEPPVASTIDCGEGDYRPHRRFIKDPAWGSFADTNPFLTLLSNSSAALMKALSEVKRFWPSLSVLRS